MNKETQEFLEHVNCPYEVFSKDTEPEKVEEAYLKALEDCKGEDWRPALVIAGEMLVTTITEQEGVDREQLIADCRDSGKKLLEERCEEYKKDYGFGEEEWQRVLGGTMQGAGINHFSTFRSWDGPGLREEVLLLKIPVKNPWEVAAWIPMGGWNDCPAVEDMMAVSKYWYEQHGAVPAVFGDDTLEYYLEKGVSKEASMELAVEHFAFCTDRVFQGTRTETVAEVAACLADAHVWYFWWD